LVLDRAIVDVNGGSGLGIFADAGSEDFVTDELLVGGCGGVHYPASDPAAMFDSLHNRLGALPEETKLYPGHDYGATPTSTLAWERLKNPALTSDTLEAFCRYKRVC
jgi:glyoxylase-like metal-dependent hydrolase (beta-lactamase superfamily II)